MEFKGTNGSFFIVYDDMEVERVELVQLNDIVLIGNELLLVVQLLSLCLSRKIP